QSLLDAHRLSGDLLILEITESAVLQDIEGTSAVIERLRRLGVALSIDDFGVGYSSMARLGQFPLPQLKRDMRRVLGLHVSAEAAAVVKAVIDLGHALGMRVVAEGVEDERSLTDLRSLGCDLAQGYVFTSALPATQFATWVADRERRRASPEAEHPITKRPPRASLPATWARDVVEAVGRPVLTTTAVALLIYLGWQAFRWGGPANQQLIGDLAFIPFNLGAIVAAVLASRAHRHD